MQLTHQLPDADLISAFLQGNDQALEPLICKHKDKIYTAVYMLVKDKYIAEDIFQETFLKIINTMRSGKYSEQGKFLPWAIRVAHNLCMDHFRRTRKDIPVTFADGRDISEIFPLMVSSASDRMEQKQTNAGVRQLIELLPEDQREVIVLRMYADMSFKQIADLTSVSINTALGRMRYGLINLRKMITEKQMVLR